MFKEIEKASPYTFVFCNTEIDVEQKKDLNVEKANIEEVLKLLFKNTSIDFTFLNQHIVLFPFKKEEKHVIQLSGFVFDSISRQTLENISVVSSNSATVSAKDGWFSLQVSPNELLTFSGLAYQKKQVRFDSSGMYPISMQPLVYKLDEVVIMAYGSETRKHITGAIGVVDAERLNRGEHQTINNQLSGLAGVYMTANSGAPGSSMSVRIRGIGSISAGSQPLYIIDGIPLISGDFTQVYYGGQSFDALSNLNPAEIENITVLKDASASALYGIRASNGVIIITSKKGSSEHKFSVNTHSGFRFVQKKLDLLNALQYMKLKNELALENGLYPVYSEQEMATNSINTNWLSEVFKPALQTKIDLSSSGGSKSTNYFINASWFDQQGTVIGTGLSKYAARLNLNHQFKRFYLNSGMSVSYTENDRVESDQSINAPLPNAISMPPVYPVYNADGSFNDDGPLANPLSVAYEETNLLKSIRNLGNINLTWKFLNSNLKLVSNSGYDLFFLNEYSFNPTTTRQGARYNGLGIDASSIALNLVQNTYIDCFHSSGNGSWSFIFGGGMESYYEKESFMRAQDFPGISYTDLSDAATSITTYTNEFKRRTNSLFAQAKYIYKEKYVFNLNGRIDGSSNFSKSHRYGIFPSFSFAWLLHEERWVKNLPYIDLMKLRTSFGSTGNDAVSSYSFLTYFSAGANYYGRPGIFPTQLGNENLKWETTTQLDLGLDISLFNQTIKASVDVYYKKTSDLLLNVPIAGSLGFSSYTENIGELENKGIEFKMEYVKEMKYINWKNELSVFTNRNKVLRLYQNKPIRNYGRGYNSIEVNHPIGVFWAYKSLGVDPVSGNIIYDDLDKNGIINELDKQLIGDPNPDFILYYQSVVEIGSFSFDIRLKGVFGNDIYNGTRMYIETMTGNDNQSTAVLNRWRNPGDQTEIPRMDVYNNKVSSRFVEDGSNVKIDDLRLQYVFKKKKINRFFKHASVYFTVQNLSVFSTYKGMDPDVNYAGQNTLIYGTDFFTEPVPVSYLFGMKLNL